jgi:pimeloyl-ACP methyl ester carboxylesterase
MLLMITASTGAQTRETVKFPGSQTELFEFIQPPPDPCVSYQIQIGPQSWPSQDMTVMGQTARLFEAGPSSDEEDSPRRHSPSARPLVLVVDGNGFSLSDYNDLAGYLAEKGFNVVVIDRPSQNGPDPVEYALAAVAEAFSELNLPPDAPVGLIGHSYGGTVVINTILENHTDPGGYNFQSAVLLSPKVSNGSSTLLTAEHIPAMLAVYGSQDNDVGGLDGELTDAFAAYDRFGDEGSTTCHNVNPLSCAYQPQMHRSMIYIHGADHAGLVNQDPTCSIVMGSSSCDPYNNYLARSDQFCVAKAYTLAMLEWTLDDNDTWKSMVHGKHVPQSIQDMTTAAPDEFGNPAGSPLRMGKQVSPNKRSMVENFEDSSWNVVNQTPNVLLQLATEGQFAGGSMNIRHATKLGLIAWPQHETWQLIGFGVPFLKGDVTQFTHLAVRLGQVAGINDPDLANTPNTSASVFIGLNDGVSTDWEWSHEHGEILPPDQRPNGQHQSVMSTIKIPLTAFHDINKNTIQAIYLAFPAGSQGTLMIDSLEWFKE